MSRMHGSNDKTQRLRWPPSSPDFRASPTEDHHFQGYRADDFLFSMSLPPTSPNVANPTRTGGRHRNLQLPPDFQSPAGNTSPPLMGDLHPNAVQFFDGNTSGTQNSMTSTGSERIAQLLPQQCPHHPTLPGQPTQLELRLPYHSNLQPQRILTAADFSRRHPPSPPSSSESSSHSMGSSVGSLSHLPPPFTPPASSTRPIPIPQPNPQPNHLFTPQHHATPPRNRKHRKKLPSLASERLAHSSSGPGSRQPNHPRLDT